MASSSSCVHNKSYQYDVFLSFRGEDTRKTFVDHLYTALDEQGIYTFKDDEELEKGRMINDDLLQSIEESRFYIIVFCKSYASSSWCLNELVKIMECHKTNEHKAFPVFYDVDPSEVRKQTGLVGEALAKLKDKSESEIGKWREALQEAANLSGWDVKNTADGKTFIGELAKDTTIDTFIKYFRKYGELTDSVIMKDRQTGRLYLLDLCQMVPGLMKIRYIGQTTLGSAAVFGLFLGAGSLIHCGKSY